MKSKIKLIPRWIALLVVSSLGLIERKFISKIPSELVKQEMKLFLEPLKLTALAISDNNPDNKEQVEKIWRKAISGKFIDFNQFQVINIIDEKIENPFIKVPLMTLVIPVFGMIRDLLDEDPMDGQQITTRWETFIKDPDVQEVVLINFVIPALERYINDDETVTFIINIIRQALENGNGQDLTPEQIQRVVSMLPPAKAA